MKKTSKSFFNKNESFLHHNGPVKLYLNRAKVILRHLSCGGVIDVFLLGMTLTYLELVL